MDTNRRIYINNDLDVVVARMQAREMARQLGFGTADQARISLAASELARLLSWQTGQPGEIDLAAAQKSGRQGIQIDCLIRQEALLQGQSNDVNQANLGQARQLVDESTIESQGNQFIHITLMKWLR